MGFAKVLNPTHGSGWIDSDPFYPKAYIRFEIPPTAVGGSFRSFASG